VPGNGFRAGLIAGAALAAGAAAYTIGTQVAAGGLRIGVVRRGPARAMAALTFDDGPDPEQTPRILDVLAAAGVQAAFFMIGRHVEDAPAVAQAVAAAGHDLGNHTYGHRHLWTLSPATSAAEVDHGAEAIATATGLMPRYFRPPWGAFNWAAYVRAGQIGEARVLWSVRSEGWLAAAPAARMAAYVVRKAHAGAIINLHDRGGHPSTPAETLAALPLMIAGLRARGLDVVPLRVLLRPTGRPATPRSWDRPDGAG
jgi:peptidoglycan/xylan/chitin deacetylase (PgdA/CDA1 family)